MGDDIGVVMDIGSFKSKVGIIGEDYPRAIFPSVVGKPKGKQARGVQIDTYVGDEAEGIFGSSILTRPIEDRYIENWDYVERIWNHSIYNEIRFTPEDGSVIIIDSPLNTRENRERIVKIMLEKFNFSSCFILNSSTASLFASGRTGGITVDSGYKSTIITPVYDSIPLNNSIVKMDVGGYHIEEYFKDMLIKKGYTIENKNDMDIIHEMKEKLSFVSLDYNHDINNYTSTLPENQYKLRNGTNIILNHEEI